MRLEEKVAIRFGAAVCALVIAFGAAGLAALPAGAGPIGGGSISGRVVDDRGSPRSNICVVAAGAASTTTDRSGLYSLTGLPAGQYDVQFSDCNPSPTFVTQWYRGHIDQAAADPVMVVDLVDTPLPDVTMTNGVSVSGTVTDPGGNPIPNVAVNVNPTVPGLSAGTQTAADGTYTAGVLPAGSYTVQFSTPDPRYAGEFWKHKPSRGTADALALDPANGPLQTGIDAQLAAAATIEGTVTDTVGTPLAGVCVDSVVPNGLGNWDVLSSVQTLGDGTYSIGGLPEADIRVQFRGCGAGPYIEQWYSGQADSNSSTPIVLAGGELRRGVDARLSTGTAVRGTVTDGTGNPIPNMNISVNPTSSGPSAWSRTDSSGQYTTNPLPPGSYTVQFQGSPSFAGEYWDDHLSRNDANVLTITAGAGPVLGGIDAVLAAGANVSGLVTDPSGRPVANLCVDAAIESSTGTAGVGGTTTASDGTYTITGLPPTSVKVMFRDCNRVGPYVQEWWNDVAGPASATPIVLAPGETRTGIDAQLAVAGAITGTVTDVRGNPLSGICAQASTPTFVGNLATTDSIGQYSIVLAGPGDYRVQFVDCSGAAAFVGQWWNGQPSPATAQLVHVEAGQVVPGIDATLAAGGPGSISGRVVNAGGAAMTTVCVVAYLPFQFALFGVVQPDGSYTIPNVPSGTYALAFLGCGSGGNPQPIVADPNISGVAYNALWWNGVRLDITGPGEGGPDPIAQGANLVTVTPGSDLVGYNVCFGCTSIVITSITPGPGSLTVAFTTPDLSATGASASASVPVTYTVTCSSPGGGVTGSATGPGSPITVTRLSAGASYTCQVAAASGGKIFAASAVSSVLAAGATAPGASGGTADADPANAGVTGSLPRTGASSPMTLVRGGFVLLVVGFVLACSNRRRRRPLSVGPGVR